MTVTNDIKYIGVNDHEIDLFEGILCQMAWHIILM